MDIVRKMQDIASTLSAYDQKKESNEKDWERTNAEAEHTHQANVNSIQSQHNAAIQAANRRKKDWDEMMARSQAHMRDMQGTLMKRMSVASGGSENAALSADDFSGMVHALSAMKRSASFPFFKSGDNDQLISIAQHSSTVMDQFREDAKAVAAAAAEQQKAEMDQAQRLFAAQSAQEDTRYDRQKNDAKALFLQRQRELNDEINRSFRYTLEPEQVQAYIAACTDAIPEHDSYVPPEKFPESICFGYAGYEVTENLGDSVKKDVLNDCFGYMAVKEDNRTYLRFPYGYSFADERFSSMFEFDKNTRASTLEHLKSLVLRLMMSTPCGKAWLTFVDPLEVGKTFSMFAPWGKVQQRIIDNQPWYDEASIEERLDSIIAHTSNINKNCLQGRFDNILQYNELAGKNAEPLRFLVIADFPHRFTLSALEKLETIITQGPSTGVFVLIAADVEAMKESMNPTVQRIHDKMNVFTLYKGAMFTSDIVNNRALRFMPLICTQSEAAFTTIEKIGQGIKAGESIVILPEDVFSKDMHYMSYDASNGICVPIGLEGANNRIELQLGGISEGGKAHTYHAMIGGSIGSGKSSLLNNIIIGTLMQYSPKEVQVYLVDLKDGVEFKRYAQHLGIANLRVVAIDAEKEFAYAVLSELVHEQELRAQRFRETGTHRIETYNQKMRSENRMDSMMPRILVVMDEVQGLFDSADDPITKKCASLLEKLILMGGSAFGIQIILATQDWANVVGLKESLYNNIGVRIALKCNRASAEKILSSDNDAIDRMATFDIGKAIFNEHTGEKNQNHEFRSVYYTSEGTHEILTRLEAMQAEDCTIIKPCNQRLLSSDVGDNKDNPLNAFAQNGAVPVSSRLGYRLWIGEGLEIVNTYFPALTTQMGQNILLAGSSEKVAANISAFAAMSFILESIRMEGTLGKPVITLFDFSNPMQGYQTNLLLQLSKRIPRAFRIFRGADLNPGLKILENEIGQADDEPEHLVIFFGLNRARRLTEGNTYAQKPRDLLVNLLREGPAKGVNFAVWANAPTMFQQNYGDALQDFEHRLVFSKTDDELYPYFVQDKRQQTETTDDREERNALAYNLDGDNQLIKLYTEPSDAWLDLFAKAVNRHYE